MYMYLQDQSRYIQCTCMYLLPDPAAYPGINVHEGVVLESEEQEVMLFDILLVERL